MPEAAIALNRFGLGFRAGDPPQTDVRRGLLQQLDRFDPAPPLLRGLAATPTVITQLAQYQQSRRDMRKANQPDPDARSAGDAKRANDGNARQDLRQNYVAAVGARAQLAIATDTPFVERLVHFWSNHFAVSADKAAVLSLAGPFENEAIRPHVLGKFSDVLAAVEQHPAMLLYLDQAQSIGPNSALGLRAGQRGKDRGLNENLAREILELHTLGVRSGYSQADVTELARALTGWTVGGLSAQPRLRGPGPGFWFADILHEPGQRTIMGRRYAQAGQAQARAVLDDLAVHPSTARHIATKLARHFCTDEPPVSLVTRLEQAFLRSGGDLSAVYLALIESGEPWGRFPAKFRTPWDWTIAALRVAGQRDFLGNRAASVLQQLGQAIWRPGSPAGFDDITASWAGPDALYRRVELAERLADRLGALDARVVSEPAFPGTLSAATRQAIARAESGSQALALFLVSPEMLRR
ncbi:MAG: DUF1800 domain-containing protein [Sphingomonadales bacterium]|nr:DUF1800 domain-containing protein [Sphingomonadales bacterium]